MKKWKQRGFAFVLALSLTTGLLTGAQAAVSKETLNDAVQDLSLIHISWGSSSIVNVGDKGSLTWAVAELRSEYDDEVLEANEVYMDCLLYTSRCV